MSYKEGKQAGGVPAEPAREMCGHPTRKKNKLVGCRDAGSIVAGGTPQRRKAKWWGAEEPAELCQRTPHEVQKRLAGCHKADAGAEAIN